MKNSPPGVYRTRTTTIYKKSKSTQIQEFVFSPLDEAN